MSQQPTKLKCIQYRCSSPSTFPPTFLIFLLRIFFSFFFPDPLLHTPHTHDLASPPFFVLLVRLSGPGGAWKSACELPACHLCVTISLLVCSPPVFLKGWWDWMVVDFPFYWPLPLHRGGVASLAPAGVASFYQAAKNIIPRPHHCQHIPRLHAS